ncbi:MAG: divergent PAP2 family protein [Erysipelotrichaceae bacterium]|nr:divergent PAP2 family protein [Erysipelotrichaceae bacterium]MBQ5444122.1 divergent PAP2 family protein [Erysipelotrichaceae bacterium]MBQ6216257.1 divergent PAP2 family protein [Erysipelotrichaceae bacterium]
MLKNYYPLVSFLIAVCIAQGVKPFIMLIKTGDFRLQYLIASGGYPSSHSAGLVALCLSIGLKDGFDSSYFAIAFAIMVVVLFDAVNVRYYSGRNISLTKQLVEDLQYIIEMKDPIYDEKFKEVLGHTKLELVAGVFLGILVSIVLYFLWR